MLFIYQIYMYICFSQIIECKWFCETLLTVMKEGNKCEGSNYNDNKASRFILFCHVAAILFCHKLHSSKTLKSCSLRIQSNNNALFSSHFSNYATLTGFKSYHANLSLSNANFHRAPTLVLVSFGSIVWP